MKTNEILETVKEIPYEISNVYGIQINDPDDEDIFGSMIISRPFRLVLSLDAILNITSHFYCVNIYLKNGVVYLHKESVAEIAFHS